MKILILGSGLFLGPVSYILFCTYNAYSFLSVIFNEDRRFERMSSPLTLSYEQCGQCSYMTDEPHACMLASKDGEDEYQFWARGSTGAVQGRHGGGKGTFLGELRVHPSRILALVF